ncbi:MAG TPA: DUF4145 domain-containing protein [Candidatus Dormibacteraeota bacterium]|nr:DUF4145 domain-containing protein [Candidatus Dormibacteraeota bacterium]
MPSGNRRDRGEWIGQHPWREGIGHGGTIRWRGSAVPKRIRSCFEEGLKCVSAGAPRGAAVMFGRALEAIVRDRGSQDAVTAMEKKNLAAGLQVMADEHIITNELGEGAKEIRLARNAGGHFDPIDDVDIAEAEGSSPLQSLS